MIRCKASAGLSASLGHAVTNGVIAGSVSEFFSYNGPRVSSTSKLNSATTGALLVTVSDLCQQSCFAATAFVLSAFVQMTGLNFGYWDISPSALVDGSAAEGTKWTSHTYIVARVCWNQDVLCCDRDFIT
jgi:hypothetical protein